MPEHEEDVNDCTMCICGTPVDLCADYWGEWDDPADVEIRRHDHA